MSRALCLLLLIAFALSIPCAHICAVSTDGGEAIASLDLCSHYAPGTPGSFITLTEHSFDVQMTLQFTDMPSEKLLVYESASFSPADRPPTA